MTPSLRAAMRRYGKDGQGIQGTPTFFLLFSHFLPFMPNTTTLDTCATGFGVGTSNENLVMKADG